jgi:hypothetical protein
MIFVIYKERQRMMTAQFLLTSKDLFRREFL